MADELMLELGQTIKDEPSFTAPDGDYRFMVKDWDVSMFQPRDESTSKIPACRQVDVTLLIPYRDELGNIVYGQKVEHFKLLARLKFAITNFFISCGIGKRGDEFKLDFDQCVGKVGTCKVQQQLGGNGNLYARIEEFYAPDVAPQASMNDGIQFMEPQQPQMQQPQANYGYGY
ncbi:MAG: hypothetical protein IJ092_10155 [Atopobiaceae bacterium]|nr:hypothetical protein [Atopobiaceae bacterium]